MMAPGGGGKGKDDWGQKRAAASVSDQQTHRYLSEENQNGEKGIHSEEKKTTIKRTPYMAPTHCEGRRGVANVEFHVEGE